MRDREKWKRGWGNEEDEKPNVDGEYVEELEDERETEDVKREEQSEDEVRSYPSNTLVSL